jgi:hypothetical protein
LHHPFLYQVYAPWQSRWCALSTPSDPF